MPGASPQRWVATWPNGTGLTLVLVGSTAFPSEPEPPDTAGRIAPSELKAALIQRLRRDAATVRTAQVEDAYTRLLRERELRSNIAAMELAGASVVYRHADVRDDRSFAGVIEDIYRTYGKIDGVIHGAGVIEDKLIEDKTPESFDRVFDTKVVGAFLLLRTLRLGLAQVPDLLLVHGRAFRQPGTERLRGCQRGAEQARRLLRRPLGHAGDGPQLGSMERFRDGQPRGPRDSTKVSRLVSPAAGQPHLDASCAPEGRQPEVVLAAGTWPTEHTVPQASRPRVRTLPLLTGRRRPSCDGDAIERDLSA